MGGEPPPQLLFRAAGPLDAPAVVELVESAYRGERSRLGWTTEADLLDGQRTDQETVNSLIGQPASRVVLAERHGILLACVHLQAVADQAYFGMFAVQPEAQGEGIGSALLEECERIAAVEWHCSGLFMTVIRQRLDLLDWYQRRGYRYTGETRPFPYGNPRFGLPRRNDLAFVVIARRFADRS